MVKLISITKDSSQTKKYIANFVYLDSNGVEKSKKVGFGAPGYTDFTIGATDKQREGYWRRHHKDLDLKNPMTAGNLSLFVLWTKRNINEAIKLYRETFKV